MRKFLRKSSFSTTKTSSKICALIFVLSCPHKKRSFWPLACFWSVKFSAENRVPYCFKTQSVSLPQGRVCYCHKEQNLLLPQGTESLTATRNRISYCLEEQNLLLPQGTVFFCLKEQSLLLPQGTESLTALRNSLFPPQGTEPVTASRNRISYSLKAQNLLLPQGQSLLPPQGYSALEVNVTRQWAHSAYQCCKSGVSCLGHFSKKWFRIRVCWCKRNLVSHGWNFVVVLGQTLRRLLRLCLFACALRVY